jgi:hypothetical protein
MKDVSRYEYFLGCVTAGLIAGGRATNLLVDAEAYVAMLEKHCDSKENEKTPEQTSNDKATKKSA